MIDSTYLTQTLLDLVAINSVNPTLSQDGSGEAQVAAYLANAMQDLGLETHLHEMAPGRVNAVGILHGTGGGKTLMWNGHIDTVGINGMEKPFTPEVRSGRVYGRGSQDMKGSVAAMLAAAKVLAQPGNRPAGDVIITGVADEEYESLGTQDIIRRYRADAAIVTEPTDLAFCRAHRGFIGFEIETHGRAAHGSRYQDGIDAILHMGRFLSELAHLEAELPQRPPHPLAGPPSLHTSIIRGGTEMSTYPAECYLMIERRTSPGETVAGATAELQAILDRLQQADPQFNASLNTFLARPAFEIAADAPIAVAVNEAMTRRFGRPPEQRGASFWTDAALLAEAGIPSVLVGPTGQGLHSAEEWVSIESCVQVAEILVDSARSFCG